VRTPEASITHYVPAVNSKIPYQFTVNDRPLPFQTPAALTAIGWVTANDANIQTWQNTATGFGAAVGAVYGVLAGAVVGGIVGYMRNTPGKGVLVGAGVGVVGGAVAGGVLARSAAKATTNAAEQIAKAVDTQGGALIGSLMQPSTGSQAVPPPPTSIIPSGPPGPGQAAPGSQPFAIEKGMTSVAVPDVFVVPMVDAAGAPLKNPGWMHFAIPSAVTDDGKKALAVAIKVFTDDPLKGKAIYVSKTGENKPEENVFPAAPAGWGRFGVSLLDPTRDVYIKGMLPMLDLKLKSAGFFAAPVQVK